MQDFFPPHKKVRKHLAINFMTNEVSSLIQLSHFYKNLMDAVVPVSDGEEDLFIAGVQCVIWGSLYIEALINKTFTRLFQIGIYGPNETHDKRTKRVLWRLSERADVTDKLEALALLFEKDKVIQNTHLSQLKRLIRIRNRLVHYKEVPEIAKRNFHEPMSKFMGKDDGSFTKLDYYRKLNDTLPTPSIVTSVLSLSLDQRRYEVHDLANWLDSIKS